MDHFKTELVLWPINCTEFFKVLITIKLNDIKTSLVFPNQIDCLISTRQRCDSSFVVVVCYPVTSFYLRLQTFVVVYKRMMIEFI